MILLNQLEFASYLKDQPKVLIRFGSIFLGYILNLHFAFQHFGYNYSKGELLL